MHPISTAIGRYLSIFDSSFGLGARRPTRREEESAIKMLVAAYAFPEAAVPREPFQRSLFFERPYHEHQTSLKDENQSKDSTTVDPANGSFFVRL